ncbi:MAG: N-acetyltransferase family protein [Acidimicrobiales bacterium]
MTDQGPAGVLSARRARDRCTADVTVLTATASHTQAVLAMLARCSRTTLFHRFHGFTDGVAHTRALLVDRPSDLTLIARHHSDCVGLATLGLDGKGNGELGVVVEDVWQRRGVGTQLVASLLGRSRAKGVATLHADVLGDDLFILRRLGRIGPLTWSVELGTISVDVDLGRFPRRQAK